MADHPRVHPAHDPEASSGSENGYPTRNRPIPPPPYRTTSPLKSPKRRSCCKKFLCWTFSLSLLVIVLLGIASAIMYFVFHPRIPRYSVDSMRINQFNLSSDNSLSATFDVNITSRNPNERIGIYYEDGSRLSLLYRGVRLCEGSVPKFYQGHRNTTLLSLTLAGRTSDAAGLLRSMQAEQQAVGGVPLSFRARVPVRISVGRLRLMEWKFLVKCRLMVYRLDADNVIRIRDSSCRFRLGL